MSQSVEVTQSGSAFAPLRLRVFRRIWSSSVVSNFGHLILGVAAAWEMTRMTDSATMVAMVQTALMLPLMFVALPAGALADMFDRRKVALVGLTIACAGGMALLAAALGGMLTPWVLLFSLFAIGSGVALYGPAWQASIGELVPVAQLPAAVALGSVSYNLARSFGPAIGGLIVLAAGVHAALAVNALGYLPLIVAYLFWSRLHTASRLPPESLSRAIVSGMRYARHSPPVRATITRVFLFGFAIATANALAPLIARDMLGGDAATYGLLLGASGVGAIVGSLVTSTLRIRIGPERALRFATLAGALAIGGLSLSANLLLASMLYVVQGFATMLGISMLNIGVQLAVPRWVTARALSLFSSAVAGGIALGALCWGALAQAISIEATLQASAAALFVTVLVGFVMPLGREVEGQGDRVTVGDLPDVSLALTARSGPIVIEIDYRVDPARAREFYQAMQAVGTARRRNGGYDWSLARDISDPELWTESYECPTWGDYLHLRDRYTQSDLDAQDSVEALNSLEGLGRVRRRLARPYGSVRWRADTPDIGSDSYGIAPP